jgi:hypothetical protein
LNIFIAGLGWFYTAVDFSSLQFSRLGVEPGWGAAWWTDDTDIKLHKLSSSSSFSVSFGEEGMGGWAEIARGFLGFFSFTKRDKTFTNNKTKMGVGVWDGDGHV